MKQLFSFFLLSSIMVSCTKNAQTDNIETAQLIPLAVGNQWVYAIEEYDTSGNLIPFSESEPILQDTLKFSDTVINDTTWYTNLPADSLALMSTANAVYGHRLVDNATNLFLKSTDKDSETIYQDISEKQYGKLVAFNKTYSKNGYDVIKNVDTSIYNNSPFAYDEYYIKPGLGIIEIDSYWANYHADGSESFSFRRKQTLTSYSVH